MYVSSSVIAGMFVALAFASEFLGERRRKLRLPIANRLERSDRTQYPSDVIALVVLWRLVLLNCFLQVKQRKRR
jgi:hypothetical protein